MSNDDIANNNLDNIYSRSENDKISFDSLCANSEVKQVLKIMAKSANHQNKRFPHTLLFGSNVNNAYDVACAIANELGVNIKYINVSHQFPPAGLASVLTDLEENDVLFVDEIHRLNHNVEEILYPAMEDFVLDVMLGSGPSARSMRFNLPKFTLIGATSDTGLIDKRIFASFEIKQRLIEPTLNDLLEYIKIFVKENNIEMNDSLLLECIKRSRKSYRDLIHLINHIHDFSIVLNIGQIDESLLTKAFNMLKIDKYGLNDVDNKLLRVLIYKYKGMPVGLDLLSIETGISPDDIKKVHEPYLIKLGFIGRTPHGRIALDPAYEYLNEN